MNTITTLPASGRWIVDTDVDTYDICQDSHIALYHDFVADAGGQVVEDEVILYDTVTCHVGQPLCFDTGLEDERKGRLVIGITAHLATPS